MRRIQPALPAASYKTYQIAAPHSTHFRLATCAEIDCPPYLNGWSTTLTPDNDPDGKLDYLIRHSGRSFKEERNPLDGSAMFVFEAGQPCFAAHTHRIRLDRPEVYAVRGGDWRGNPLNVRPVIHTRPELWIEDFAEHQDRLVTKLERG